MELSLEKTALGANHNDVPKNWENTKTGNIQAGVGVGNGPSLLLVVVVVVASSKDVAASSSDST
jgi:hypothetical protein